MFQNTSNLSVFENWKAPEPLATCSALTKIGIYCVILLILSLTASLKLIWIFLMHRVELLNGVNIIILTLTLLNLLGALIELPLVATASFMCKYDLKLI